MSILPKKKLPLFEVTEFSNFREMLLLAKEEAGETVALEEKRNEELVQITYEELYEKVRSFATALMLRNFGTAHVAISAENSTEWIIAYLAALSSNEVFVPLDVELSLAESANILNHSDAEVLITDEEHFNEFNEHRFLFPKVKLIVLISCNKEKEEKDVVLFDTLLKEGDEAVKEENEDYENLFYSSNDLKMIVYRSGNADSLRGIMLSDLGIRSVVLNALMLSPVGERCLAVLPFHRTLFCICNLLTSLHSHSTVCINESESNFSANLKAYHPDYLVMSPLHVENIWRQIEKTIANQGRTETFATLIKTSNTMRKVGIDKRRSLFSGILEMLGGSLELMFVGGTGINPEAIRFFDDIGVTVLSGYGVPECSSIVSMNREKLNDYNSAGVLLPCVQVKIDNPSEEGEGEICIRGDVVMMGYYKNEKAYREKVEYSGWLHTGDLGKINALGQLYITGNMRNEIVFKSGRTLRPSEIEGYILALPFVKAVKVYAEESENTVEYALVANVILDENNLGGMTKEEQRVLVKNKIDALNKTLPPYKRTDTVHILKMQSENTDN